uniref:Uncharacterized protein n=1 Tax=Ovis aries TaxID=9940 RepID=A0AC11BYP7_SHEEP
MEKKCKKAKWLSGEALQKAVKRREVKSKGEKERYKHLNAEFQRIARREKKAFFSDQCKEIEEKNRMGKTRDLFKKIRDTKGTFHANMGSIKDRNGLDLTKAEDIKKRWQEYTEELYKKDLHDPDKHDDVITHLEPDILECEVKWALESITTGASILLLSLTVSSVGVTGAGRLLCKRYLTMLSWVVLSAAAAAAPSLKNAAFLGPGVLQPSLAPVPPLPEHGGKVHFGLIPEEFFQFLYPKTGVTGPYVLGTGLILYLLSKEIYVITPETASAISTIGFLVYVVKKYGASVGEFADKLNEQKIAQLEEVKQASIKQIQDAIDMEKSQQALVQKRHYLFDVQRNNIAMALEVTYRERLHRVYREVKNRLDYHISVQNMMRQKEQEHMINWVEKHVVQSIPAQQEKETIAKCIADLKLLAKKAQAQPVM